MFCSFLIVSGFDTRAVSAFTTNNFKKKKQGEGFSSKVATIFVITVTTTTPPLSSPKTLEVPPNEPSMTKDA